MQKRTFRGALNLVTGQYCFVIISIHDVISWCLSGMAIYWGTLKSAVLGTAPCSDIQMNSAHSKLIRKTSGHTSGCKPRLPGNRMLLSNSTSDLPSIMLVTYGIEASYDGHTGKKHAVIALPVMPAVLNKQPSILHVCCYTTGTTHPKGSSVLCCCRDVSVS